MAKKSLLAALGLAVIGALSPNLAHANGQKEQNITPIVKTEAEQRETEQLQKLQDYFGGDKRKESQTPAVAPTVNSPATTHSAVNDSVFNTPTGDFMLVTDYMHKTNRNEKTNIDALVKGGNITRIYALDPSEAIRSRIKFLDSTRAKGFYSQEERLDLIGRYQNFLNELITKKIAPSKKSLEGLSAAVMDGEITPEELKDVEDNVYAIVKEGIDKKVGAYSVFYLTTLTSEKTPNQYQAKIKELENAYNELVKKGETKKTDIQKEKDYRSVYLLAQQTASADLTSYITSIGTRWNPFKKVDIGFGANLDIGFGLDKQIDSYTAPLSAGRTASGTATDIGKFSIGGSLEAQFGPLIVGGGIDYKQWTSNVIEQILSQSGDVVKSNTNSVPNRQVFGKVYGGVEIPFGKDVKIGMTYGYNGKDDMFFGIRGGFKIK